MYRRLQELARRTASTLSPWLTLGGLITLADFQQWWESEVVILHLAVVIAAFQLTARRHLPRLMLVTLLLVWLPWLLSWLITGSGEPAWGRLWVTLCLVLAGLYHIGNQQRRQRRLFIRKQLQQSVRGRTLQLRRANEALRAEIVARQATQQRLDRAQTHLQSLAQRMRLQVLRKDTRGVITYANDAFCQAVGRPPEEVIGSTDADLYPEPLAAKYRLDDELVLRTGSTVDHIESHPAADGKTGWVQVFKAPELDSDDRIIGIQIIFWDVTDRHRQTAELRRSEARKRALFNASREAVLLVDDQGVVVEANAAAVSLLGHASLPLAGIRLADLAVLYPPTNGTADGPAAARPTTGERSGDDQPAGESSRPLLRWADLPYGVRRQIGLKPAGKATFPAEVSVHPIPLDTSTGLAIFVRDVTLQQRALAALHEGKLAAEKASRVKSEFMASVSHEIRTPLGGILGSADLLAEMPLLPRAQQYVEMIQHSGRLLANVIADILDLASIEAGRLQITTEPIDFHRCIGEAFRSLATRAIGKDLELVLEIDAAVPRYLEADPKRLRQIVVNLVGNAIKFTAQGFVRLTADVSADDWLEIAVSDSGVGIPAEHRSKIFEPFEQGDSGTTRRYGGTGLGLSISQQLIQRMGGQIEVVSAVGQGSTFRCRLPLRRCPPPATYQPIGDLPREVALLVPQPQQQATIAKLLTQRGIAIQPQAAVRIVDVRHPAARSGQSPHPSRTLWLARVDDPSPIDERADAVDDTHQPDDGDHTAMSDSRPGDGSPPSDSTPTAAAHAIALLLKPILPDDLLQWLASGRIESRRDSLPDVTEAAAAAHPATPATGAAGDPADLAAPAAPRLLVADDSPVNQTVIRDFLSAAGFHVDVVGDGHAAVDAANQQRYRCVLMDLQMPGMDGVEAMQRIQQQDQTAGRHSPPFIALTAHATDDHRQRCLDAGMKAFLVKPINRQELVATIQYWLDARHGLDAQRGPDARHGPDQPDHHSAAAPPAAPQQPAEGAEGAWHQRLLRAAGNNPATAAALVEAFLEEVPHLLRQLNAALAAGDAKAAGRAAHTLKSCLKYVADEQDWRQAERCEKSAASGDLSAVQTLLPELTEVAGRWVSRLAASPP